jgi:hypothetical protein
MYRACFHFTTKQVLAFVCNSLKYKMLMAVRGRIARGGNKAGNGSKKWRDQKALELQITPLEPPLF